MTAGRGRAARWVTAVGGLVDDAILGAMRLRFDRKAPPPAAVDDRRAMLRDVIPFYGQLGDGLFAEPRPAQVRAERRGKLPGGGEIVDLAWPSGWVPAYEPIRASYLAYQANQRACARLFRHGGAPPRSSPEAHAADGSG